VTQTVVVTSVSTCPQPSGLNAINVQCDRATLGWASLSGNSLVQWGPAGFTPGTGTVVNTISPYVLTGLNPGTAYQFWVADICSSNGDTSVYSGPVSFTTPTAPLPFLNSLSWAQTSTTLTNAELTFTTNAGPAGVSYLWDFGNGTSGTTANPVATYLQNGQYSVTLQLSNGCGTYDTTFTVTLASIGIDEDVLGAAVRVFPNPTTDRFNAVIDQADAGEFRFTLTNALGQVIEQRDWSHKGGTSEVEFDLSSVAKGIYMLRIDNGEASVTRRIHRN
jgi:PKD repeat protein